MPLSPVMDIHTVSVRRRGFEGSGIRQFLQPCCSEIIQDLRQTKMGVAHMQAKMAVQGCQGPAAHKHWH